MCAQGPFQSAASSLVNEAEHPVQQLEVLDRKAAEHEALGDTDAVIECRIKQLALQRLLFDLFEFPIQDVIRAQIALADAYTAGKYLKQASEHIAQAREALIEVVHDDAQSQRMKVDILTAEGRIHLAKDNHGAAQSSLTSAARLIREVYGMDARTARVQSLLGDIAMAQGRFVDAIDHFSAAWEAQEDTSGAEAEETIKLRLRIAEAQHRDGQVEEAMMVQWKIIEKLKQIGAFPGLLVDASAQLARWHENNGAYADALAILQVVESTVFENLGPDNAKAVQIKSDIALLHLNLQDYDTALLYLNDVHYFERCLHGSQSTNVARTLKALGTVHMYKKNVDDAEQCLCQALRIFEADYPPNNVMIRDIHSKLNGIGRMASMPRQVGADQ